MTRHTLIVGLGKTGLSCARFLTKKGYSCVVTDTRHNPPGLEALRTEFPSLPLALGGFTPEFFQTAEKIIISPGVAVAEPLIQEAIRRGIPVIGDIELFAYEINNLVVASFTDKSINRPQLIAVTGSNGKSTVVSLLGEMARTAGWNYAVGGNFGEPALNLLHPECQLYILELSSFQLETTYNLSPDAATVLNISPDHMDRYPNVKAYEQAKARIYINANYGIYNRDDTQVQNLKKIANDIGFTLHAPNATDFGIAQHEKDNWLFHGVEPLLPITDLKILGRHNLANALAALALGTAVKLPMSAMLTTLRNYAGLNHRTQLITIRNGISWYNDSKGTNIGATIAALEGLHPQDNIAKAILIAGGDGKGADFSALAPTVARTCRTVILIGRDAPIIEQAIAKHTKIITAVNLAHAVTVADQISQPGDHVLLSPACASFDMFRNYEHRGEEFTKLVRGLNP
jgi:UDP-N-acetylmuramoylalanine--D-glutamate ligase